MLSLATTYIVNTSKTIFSVEDNITDIVTNVNHLHEQMEKNTHGIHSMMDFKEKCKLLFWLLIVLKYEYYRDHLPDIYLIMNDVFSFFS